MVGYGLARTGNHVSQQIMDKVDTSKLNIAARKVVGTNISGRREMAYALADINNTSNHLINKTANMLDRVLRSSNTVAQLNASLFTQTLYRRQLDSEKTAAPQAWDGIGYAQESEERDEITKKGVRNGKNTAGSILEYRWELTKERWKTNTQLPTQESIYDVNLDTAELLKEDAQLMYTRRKNLGAYETATAILQSRGWRPSVVFYKIMYPDNTNEVDWTKMHWGSDSEREGNKTDANRWICLTVEPIKVVGYAAGSTRIDSTEMGQERIWAHVFGTKITTDPICLAGANQIMGLKKLEKHIEQIPNVADSHAVEMHSKGGNNMELHMNYCLGARSYIDSLEGLRNTGV